MAVVIDSGDFPSAKNQDGGDLDRVIGKWQTKISRGFNEGAEWLLQAINEVVDLELWKTYWGGGFEFNKSREAFIKRKLLVDFDIVEDTLPAILEKLKQGEPVELTRKSGEVVPLGLHGGNRKVDYQDRNPTLKTRGRDYDIARLARDRPDLLEQVNAGTLTANAAAILAGFRKPPTRITSPDTALDAITSGLKADDRVSAVIELLNALKPAEFRAVQLWLSRSKAAA